MVRVYQKEVGNRPYANRRDEVVEEALQKVADGELSILRASKMYNIPYGTLHNRFNGKHGKKPGGQTIFSDEDEKNMIAAVSKCGDWGFPLTLMDLRLIAKTSLDKRGIIVQKFKDNLPGDDWARSLLKRHNTLTQRITTNISRCRAEVSPATINSYFDNLSSVLKDIPADNIFNYDETNLQDDPGKKKFLFKRGTKYPVQVQNHSKSATTIMVCGSASGVLLPPYIIYKSKNLWESWTNEGPKGSPCCESPCCSKGTRYNCTPHGWMDGITFKEWFFNLERHSK
ncbi:uncharacterized protein LOC100571097 [Acyrthosiphon pisum]|uniref:HTH psq-type domain-containing protein n=1 Tax=Acyrthosiphon pisum TaxID=7029 RepID=A0A8R1W4D6_ACYPI|nr:uncharacterized protein LOC100571097 [Acyrthosiphon pisum]|eukprot:XP_003241645.2 PREDICTED: uncharacterized protein LOC100571097 [Acyrthosiphon pisum]